MKSKLEYIWLDGFEPTQSLRSKTQVVSDFTGELKDCPMWSFDGSSTQQATGDSSDCLLKPVAIIPDEGRDDAFLVMTEVLNADGSPHSTNGRATIDDDDDDFWFGFEQEYYLWDTKTNLPPGFPAGGYPGPQGPYYCSVGAQNAHGRSCVEDHLDLCLASGLNVEGINAEVEPANGNFRFLQKVLKKLEMKLGSQGIYWSVQAKIMATLLITIQNPLVSLTGMARGCMPIFQTG